MTAATALPPFRADQVGSLLRPPALADARARCKNGELDPGRWANYGKLQRELRAIEARSSTRVRRELKRRWKARARETRRARRYGGKP